MTPEPGLLWRAFPWDSAAAAGEPYSAAYVPPNQGSGRFDLTSSPVSYFAESAEHAVAEKLQRFRGQEIDAADLSEFARPLALVSVRVAATVAARVADLCDPRLLLQHRIRPDEVAARSSATTQRIAARLFEAGFVGLRWWSSFWGEWHGQVLFTASAGAEPAEYDAPEVLTLKHPAVSRAAAELGIRVAV